MDIKDIKKIIVDICQSCNVGFKETVSENDRFNIVTANRKKFEVTRLGQDDYDVKMFIQPCGGYVVRTNIILPQSSKVNTIDELKRLAKALITPEEGPVAVSLKDAHTEEEVKFQFLIAERHNGSSYTPATVVGVSNEFLSAVEIRNDADVYFMNARNDIYVKKADGNIENGKPIFTMMIERINFSCINSRSDTSIIVNPEDEEVYFYRGSVQGHVLLCDGLDNKNDSQFEISRYEKYLINRSIKVALSNLMKK